MPSLTIPFPEGTRTVTLRGNRISVGRLPDNVIQIRDRTISAYHAELIEDGDHYRLCDKGSTNGVIVGGQRVTDYHLREDCQINFGGMACEFNAAAQEETAGELDALPTRSEVLTILQANGDLKTEVDALRAQVETMLKARQAPQVEGQSVPLEQHDQLAAEVAALKASLHEKQTQIDRLTSLLAITSRERDSLQKGYDDARAALEKSRAEANPAEDSAAAQTAPSSAAPTAPATPSAPTVSTAPAAPAAPKAPSAPGAPRVPQPAGTGIKPAAAPRVPGATPTAAPVGTKPLPKPPGTIGSGSPSRRPASGAQPAPVRQTGAAAALVAAGTGPKGTQKLVE